MSASAPKSNPRPQTRPVLRAIRVLLIFGILGVLAYVLWDRSGRRGPPPPHFSSEPFASVPIAGLSARLFTDGDHLHPLRNDVLIEFRTADGSPVDVGDVHLELDMSMPSMVMHSMGVVNRTETPGQYRTTVQPQMTGDWTAKIDFSGPRGSAQTNFFTTVE
jgi:hypothetical protein